jgi:hypothetical protein
MPDPEDKTEEMRQENNRAFRKIDLLMLDFRAHLDEPSIFAKDDNGSENVSGDHSS